jgi:tetratricopeptide (TPR) repeat protein
VANQLAKVFPNNYYTNRGLWQEYLPHALALVQEKEFSKQQEQHTDLVRNIAGCLLKDGRYKEAEALYRGLLDLNQERNGPRHPSTLTGLDDMASTYHNQGRWNEAEKLQVQVMETRKTVLGAEHPDTLTSMANLASSYWNQ